jgi:hypothetical protein
MNKKNINYDFIVYFCFNMRLVFNFDKLSHNLLHSLTPNGQIVELECQTFYKLDISQ